MAEKGNRKAPSKWQQSGERALLELWNEKIPQLRGCRKNSHILQEISVGLEELGFKYGVDEIKTKMHNMTTRYRKEKLRIGASGGSPSEWDLYKDMEALLAPYKSYNCEALVSDSINNINSNIVPAPSTIVVSPQSIDITLSPSASNVPPPSPSPSTSNAAPLSPTVFVEDSPCTPKNKKKNNSFENITKLIQNSMEKIHSSSQKMLLIEEEKKDLLKSFVEKERELQEAIIQFLKK